MRNVKPIWSRFGLLASLIVGGIDMWIANVFGINILGTMKHGKSDAKSTMPAKNFRKPLNLALLESAAPGVAS